MGRAAIAIGAVLVLAGGGALGYALTRKPSGGLTPQASGAMASAVSQLDGEIKAARGAVRERARTLAALPQVRSAIETDAATARDMVSRGELDFQPRPGEVIELAQLGADGKPVVLAVQPPDGMVAPLEAQRAELMGDRVLILETADVEKRAGGVAGYLRVTRPLDLKPAIDALVAAGVNGRIEVGGKTRAIGSPPPDAKDEIKPLPSEEGSRLVVAMAPPAPQISMPLVAAGAGAAGLGLILVAIAMLAGKRSRTGQTVFPPALGEPVDPRDTKVSAVRAVVAGTPAPVGQSGPPAYGQGIGPQDLGPGALIGRWEVVRRLGSGGMADVYLAHARGEAGFEKLVAIKVMHGHLARNQRAVDHFLDEARLAARIDHPNVVGIQDLGNIGNYYVIVMDYVEGVDLERLLASARAGGRPVPLDVGLGVLCRICAGLDGAHRAIGPDGEPLGIIHRDVKSANVLVSRQGGVKVVDFGIAKAAKQVHYTVAGETKGTPSMMAPEQRVGEQVDVRADVYSVAAVAYEVLTGHAVNLDLAALAHLGVDNWPHLPAPSSLRAELPVELDAILLTAMAFERERRPADCAALEAQLEAVAKRYQLTASDKDIARWADGELRLLAPAA
ncbi:MAG: serine/threonine-protein kinase [Kofleriaceae bacterium]